MAEGPRIGDRVEHLELESAWLVDPVTGREGAGSLEVEDGRIAGIEWQQRRPGAARPDIVVMPALVDLHAHFREPGREDAETVASGSAAAAHGGFGTVCLMPNTKPAIDTAGALVDLLARARTSGSPVRVLAYGASTVGRAGEVLAPMGELADAGAIGFSDDGSPVSDPSLFRNLLLYAGGLGRPVVEHAEDAALTKGAEANEGLVATILGLKGWPPGAEESAVARDLAILAEAVRAAPHGETPRLHLTHLSTAASVDLGRRAKAGGLPVTCDVTPHHLAFHDGWVAGDRRYAWEAVGSPWTGGPADAAPYDTSTRVNPPLRAPSDAHALIAGLTDGTVDAIATDHAPHTVVDKHVEYGDAANGISGIETALGVVLAAVEASQLSLVTAVRALTVGPARVLGLAATAARRGRDALVPGLTVGAAASLIVVDRADGWVVAADTLRSRGVNTPLLGRRLPGRVLATIVEGRFAYLDTEEG